MHLSAPFIQRPVATSLLSLALLLAGSVAYSLLPVASLPNIDMPVIGVGGKTVLGHQPLGGMEGQASDIEIHARDILRMKRRLNEILALQLDPYYVAPLWPDPVSLAALQARALIDAGKATEADFAAIASRSRRDALDNPKAQVANDIPAEKLLEDEYIVSPLRRHALPPITDGVAAIVLAAGDKARQWSKPVWITGLDHRIETHSLGARDLTSSPSTARAAEGAGVSDGRIDVAELHAPFAHQEIILKEALGLDDTVIVNPSGGPLAANPIMSAGLIRIGEAATRISSGRAHRAVAHATSGPCLQQNLVCVLEGE